MNMVIVLEILVGIVVLAAAVRFAVRDIRQRRGVTEAEDTGEALVRGGEREAEQDPSEVASQQEGEKAAAPSAAPSAVVTVPEPPADAR